MDLNEIDWAAQVPACTGDATCKACRALNATFPCSNIAPELLRRRNEYRSKLPAELTLALYARMPN